MSDEEDILSKITYVRGPQGQIVVLVPIEEEDTKEETRDFWYKECGILLCTFGTICLVLAIIFMVIHLIPAEDIDPDINRGMRITIISLYGAGVLFKIMAIPLLCCLDRTRSVRVSRYMHRDEPNDQEALRQEEVSPEEVDPEAFTRTYQINRSTESEIPVYGTDARSQRENYPSGYPMGSLRTYAHRSGIYSNPLQRNYPSNTPHATKRGDSYSGHPIRQYEDQYSPSQNPFRYSGRPYSGRGSPGRTNTGTASPQYSSPGGERSVSPSSDTTYLSNYSSRADGQPGYRV